MEVPALGTHATWPLTGHSEIALVADDGTGWRLTEFASSYDRFLTDNAAEILRHKGSVPDASALVAMVKARVGRRASDN